jgi:hypothetical protein
MPWQQTEYRPEYCQIAFEVLSKGKSLAAVCAKLGISRTTLYKWKGANQELADAIEAGLQVAQAHWEDLGESGVSGEIKNFAGTPWIFTMKNRFRSDYAGEDEFKRKDNTDFLLEELQKTRAELDAKNKKDC